MGAPGALIPAEVPGNQLPNSFLNIRSVADVTAMPTGMRALPDGVPPVSSVGSSRSDEASSEPTDNVRRLVEENQTERCENEFGKFLPSPQVSCQSSSIASAKASSAQKKKVKNVSKYVISAAKNPEFAQKLHAVLLESGASPPPDLFSDISPQEHDEDRLVELIHARDLKIVGDGVLYHHDNLFSHQDQSHIPVSRGNCSNYCNIDNVEGFSHERNELSLTSDTTNQGHMLVTETTEPIQTDAISVAIPPINPPRLHARAFREEQAQKPVLPFEANPGQRHLENAYVGDDQSFFEDAINNDLGKDSAATTGLCISSDIESERINQLLGDSDEWEIPWEDLRIGERIGIGKTTF